MSADNLFKDYRWCGIVYRRLKGILVEGAVANDLMNEAMAKLLARSGAYRDSRSFFPLFLPLKLQNGMPLGRNTEAGCVTRSNPQDSLGVCPPIIHGVIGKSKKV